ncbi:hypothetical protein [Spirosoma litoris]
MTEKAKILAEKLLALARRGVGGEKENAEQMLLKHLTKYGLTLAEFERTNETIKFTIDRMLDNNSERNVFYIQVIASVIGQARTNKIDTWIQTDKKKSWYEIIGTLSEKIEIEAKVEIYWRDYQEQQRLFYEAYVQKNHLYALPEPKSSNEEDDKPLTPEEKARAYKMAKMMDGIDRKTIYKELQ